MNSLHSQLNQRINKLQAQLRQRDAALFAMLDKYGPKTVSQLDLNESKPGCLVVCDFDADTLTVTFRAVKPKEINYEEVQGSQEVACPQAGQAG